jgi:hypothetical protein
MNWFEECRSGRIPCSFHIAAAEADPDSPAPLTPSPPSLLPRTDNIAIGERKSSAFVASIYTDNYDNDEDSAPSVHATPSVHASPSARPRHGNYSTRTPRQQSPIIHKCCDKVCGAVEDMKETIITIGTAMENDEERIEEMLQQLKREVQSMAATVKTMTGAIADLKNSTERMRREILFKIRHPQSDDEFIC